MSPAFRDLLGETFGRLTAVGLVRRTPEAMWKCQCVCGTERVVRGYSLTAGHTQSCGCYNRDILRQGRHGHARRGVYSKIYGLWRDIIRRCTDPTHHAYSNYGGRGIRICKRWRHSFEAFQSDIGPKPSPSHSLDRKNVNGHYAPKNVRWATKKQQARNTRANLIVIYRGRPMTLAEAVERTGAKYHTAYNRLARGMPVEVAVRPGRMRPGKNGHRWSNTIAVLGRACVVAGLTLAEIQQFAKRKKRRSSRAAFRRPNMEVA